MAATPTSSDSSLVTWRGGLDDGALECLDEDLTPLVLVDLTTVIGKLSGPKSWSGQAAAILAAFGIFLACQRQLLADHSNLETTLNTTIAQFQAACPTNVALGHACERLRVCWAKHVGQLDGRELCARLLMEARRWQRESTNLQERAASHLLSALPDRGGVLIAGTAACHPGAAALTGVTNAVSLGRRLSVHLSGSTAQLGVAWADTALTRAKIPHATIPDVEVSAWFAARRVQVFLLGADAIFTDGTVISDPGSAALVELAVAHRAQVIIASPASAIGNSTKNADPSTVVPPSRIHAIVTEHGVSRAPFVGELIRLQRGDESHPAV